MERTTNTILEYSDQILQYLLDKRKSNPELKFWLRQRNTNKRLDDGYWFQGNNDYAFVGGCCEVIYLLLHVVLYFLELIILCFLEICKNDFQS